MPASFENAEDLLRHAVTYRQFSDVDALVHAYCSEANLHLRSLTEQDPRHKETLTRVMDVLEWTRLMLVAARTACGAKLERAALIDRYLGSQTAEAAPATRLDF